MAKGSRGSYVTFWRNSRKSHKNESVKETILLVASGSNREDLIADIEEIARFESAERVSDEAPRVNVKQAGGTLCVDVEAGSMENILRFARVGLYGVAIPEHTDVVRDPQHVAEASRRSA